MTAPVRKRSSSDKDGLLSGFYDRLPHPCLVVDSDMRVLLSNPAAARLFEPSNPQLLWSHTGEVFGCIHSRGAGCGKAGACTTCLIKAAVQEALTSQVVQRRRARVERLLNGVTRDTHLLVTAIPLPVQAEARVALLLEDISELLTLPGLLPICASCKAVRTEQQTWESIEAHLNRHLEVDFSHSLCPTCASKLYPPKG